MRELGLYGQMELKIVLLVLLFSGWTNLAVVILLINLTVTFFGKKLFAGFCSKFVAEYNRLSQSTKVELFKDLNDMKKVSA